MRTGLLAALAVVCLAGGCASFPPPPQADEPPQFEFRLGPGDRILVGVWGEKRLQKELQLGPDGKVSFPLIGDVALGGKTLDEARIELARRLRAGYVDPVVSISLVEMRSHVIHVLGEVEKPGTVAFVRGATVLAAIQAAGGVRPATADLANVRLIRNRTAEPRAYRVDLEGILAGEVRDTWLIPGDSVYVPPRTLTRWNRWWRQLLFWSDPVDSPR